MRTWLGWMVLALPAALAPEGSRAQEPVAEEMLSPQAEASAAAGEGYGGALEVPRVLGALELRVDWVLRLGYAQARDWLEGSQACRGLFAALGADGPTVLSRAIYSAPAFRVEEKICGRQRIAAFTSVGPGRTVLCPAFGTLRPNEAAVTVLHEALHNAGRTEWPRDPQGPSAAELDRLVKQSCRSDPSISGVGEVRADSATSALAVPQEDPR